MMSMALGKTFLIPKYILPRLFKKNQITQVFQIHTSDTSILICTLEKGLAVRNKFSRVQINIKVSEVCLVF